MKNRLKATISELALLAYNLPKGKEINFSCDRDEDFWAVRHIEIFDGPMLVVGSYGGGLTVAKDIQVDGGLEEIELFLEEALEDHTIDEVFIDPESSTIIWEEQPLSFEERFVRARIERTREFLETLVGTRHTKPELEELLSKRLCETITLLHNEERTSTDGCFRFFREGFSADTHFDIYYLKTNEPDTLYITEVSHKD